jgi:signal transduction histidine kinase/ActR/RegA family two-component response regulator/HPt (histidine-containing phosphotransfer) domain-containing protein
MFIDVFHNLGLLSFVTLVLFLIGVRFQFGFSRVEGKIFLGLVFAGMALVLVQTPVRIPEGATFDLRAAPAVLASFFGGPIAGLITATTAGVARYSLGGPAALGGAISPFLYASAGLIGAWAFRRTGWKVMGFKGFALLGLVSTFCVLPAFFIGLPTTMGLTILGKLWPALFGGNVIGILVLGVLVEETQRIGRERIAFRNASIAAKEGLEAKNRFLSAISHDIRTPLNGIMGALQILEGQNTNKADGSLIRIATTSGRYLSELVDQILEFAHLESGEISLQRKTFTINQILGGIRSIFAEQANGKGLALNVELTGGLDRSLEGDYDHLRQILYNLVGNAIRFTDQGHVSVAARIEPANGDPATPGASSGARSGASSEGGAETVRITFSVTDTGIGISEADQGRVFEQFYRSPTAQANRPGNGLGLSIAKGLADRMGGDLLVESEIGKGSQFIFTVEIDVTEGAGEEAGQISVTDTSGAPVDAAPTEPASVVKPPQTDSKAISVLVVDDNALNRDLMKAGLERLGFHTKLADGGISAIEAVRTAPDAFDVVLMDIQMPDLDGDEATKVIRGIVPDSKALPVIAVTANALPDQVQRYLQAGMNAVMTKPVNFEALRDEMLRYTTAEPISGSAPKGATAGATEMGAEIGAAEDRSVSISELPLIDREQIAGLKTYLSDDKLSELMTATFGQIDEVIHKLREAVNAQDGRTIRTLAHNIKGMSANMGFSKLTHQANRIIESRSEPEIAKSIDTLADLLEQTKTHLSETKV